MSQLYSVIHIFGVFFLLRINYCDAANVHYYNYNAQYPVKASELPYETTEPAFWAKGEPCAKRNSGFTCCTSFSIRYNTPIPVCTKFIKKNAFEWTVDLVMHNGESMPLVEDPHMIDRRICQPVSNEINDMFCVSFSPLERTKIRVNFTTTLDYSHYTYGLYFDEINYEIDPTPQALEQNPSVRYFKRGSPTAEPYNPPEPGKLLHWAHGGTCHIGCCADYKGRGEDSWAYHCVVLIQKSPQEWYMSGKSLSSRGHETTIYDLGDNPNNRACFFISDNTVDQFCVRFETDRNTKTNVTFETTIGQSTYELRFATYDFKFTYRPGDHLPEQARITLNDYFYYYSF